LAKRIDQSHSLNILYYKDTASSEGTGFVWTDTTDGFAWTDTTNEFEWTSAGVGDVLSMSEGSNRLVRVTSKLSQEAWCHRFGFKVETSATTKGFQPVGWGIEYTVTNMDV
jgi:hypothetical protein